MIFLYAILGMFMFTNIISIFEMASAINNQQTFDSPKSYNNDLLLSKREKDRRFLKLLSEVNNSLGSGNSLCQNLIDGITNNDNNNFSVLSNYNDLANYKQSIPINSQNPLFANGCDLNSASHRVLIVPSQDNPNSYLFYSCISDGLVCKFEVD